MKKSHDKKHNEWTTQDELNKFHLLHCTKPRESVIFVLMFEIKVRNMVS